MPRPKDLVSMYVCVYACACACVCVCVCVCVCRTMIKEGVSPKRRPKT